VEWLRQQKTILYAICLLNIEENWVYGNDLIFSTLIIVYHLHLYLLFSHSYLSELDSLSHLTFIFVTFNFLHALAYLRLTTSVNRVYGVVF
jgi:hypothetical protein